MKIKASVLISTVALTLLCAAPATAAVGAIDSTADPVVSSPVHPDSGYGEESGLAISAPEGEMSTLNVVFSPAQCVGKTDYAHKSGSQSSVHGRTTCRDAVPYVYVNTFLWHHAWFGWSLLNSDYSSKTNSKTSQDGHPHNNCSTNNLNDFRGTSTHISREGGNEYTTGTVGVTKSFRC